MKRVLIVISLILISIFSFSCKKDEELEPIYDDQEPSRSYSLLHYVESPIPSFNFHFNKEYYAKNEDIRFDFFVAQSLFNNNGTPSIYNYFENVVDGLCEKYIGFSKIEIRFIVGKNSRNDSDSIIISDFIDVTQNSEYIVRDTTSLSQLWFNNSRHEGKLYYREVKKDNPIKISFNPNILTQYGSFRLFLDIRLTFSDELINSSYDNSEKFEMYYNLYPVAKLKTSNDITLSFEIFSSNYIEYNLHIPPYDYGSKQGFLCDKPLPLNYYSLYNKSFSETIYID